MEGSVAAGTEGAAAAVEGGQEQAPSGVDFSPVLERFDALAPRIERMEQQFAQFGQQQGEPAGQEPAAAGEDFDVGGLFDIDSGVDPQQAQQMLQQLVDSRTQSQLDAALAPVLEQVRGIQVGLDAEQLAAKYPALADASVAGPVVQRARELAEHAGHPELATNMQFIETIYKAQMADQYAAGERPVGGEQQFELERGGGAGPGAAAEESNIADRIVAGRQKQEFWRGW